MRTSRYFTSYLSAGLLTTAIAAVAFTRLSFTSFAFVGLTVGIATRNPRRCATGLLTSLGMGLMVVLLMPISTEHVEGIGLDRSWPVYAGPLLGALAGASLQLDDTTLTATAMVGAALSLIVLCATALLLRAYTVIEFRMLERWEYATIVLAVPVIGAGVWWPVDIMEKYLERRLERRAAALRLALLKRG